MAAEARFRAMGTDVHLIAVDAPADALRLGRARVEDLERRWSRFVPASEVSRLNEAAGRPVRVSVETASLVRLAVEGWRATGGVFDPTTLPALVAAGYDRTFDDIPADHDGPAPAPAPAGRCDLIRVDGATGAVMLPNGTAFDPGGIGKGFAADLVVADLIDAGASGACANIGGDLRVAGRPPEGGEWVIDVEDPFGGEPVAVLHLAEGAVATTTTTRRRWRRGGVGMHHLIDPATGEPSGSDLASVTVVASHGWRAEVLAKAAFLAGSRDASGVITGAGASGVLVDADGAVHAAGPLAEALA